MFFCCCNSPPPNLCFACRPFQPPKIPSAFTLIDSRYGTTTLSYNPTSAEYTATINVSGVSGADVSCTAAATITVPIKYEFFCSLGNVLTLKPSWFECGTGVTMQGYATTSAANGNFALTSLLRVDDSTCSTLDLTFNVTGAFVAAGNLSNFYRTGGAYGGTIRIHA